MTGVDADEIYLGLLARERLGSTGIGEGVAIPHCRMAGCDKITGALLKLNDQRAMRAVADDHQAALSVGISLSFIWVLVWSLAGFVALVAGIMWGAKSGVQFSLSLIALKALPVLILGGFTSIPGAIVGGLIVGVGEKLFEFLIGAPFLGGATENWFAYMLALVFLVFRPQGLFGEKIIERV
jgi:branched-chain amino acid transport system permease protein